MCIIFQLDVLYVITLSLFMWNSSCSSPPLDFYRLFILPPKYLDPVLIFLLEKNHFLFHSRTGFLTKKSLCCLARTTCQLFNCIFCPSCTSYFSDLPLLIHEYAFHIVTNMWFHKFLKNTTSVHITLEKQLTNTTQV